MSRVKFVNVVARRAYTAAFAACAQVVEDWVFDLSIGGARLRSHEEEKAAEERK